MLPKLYSAVRKMEGRVEGCSDNAGEKPGGTVSTCMPF